MVMTSSLFVCMVYLDIGGHTLDTTELHLRETNAHSSTVIAFDESLLRLHRLRDTQSFLPIASRVLCIIGVDEWCLGYRQRLCYGVRRIAEVGADDIREVRLRREHTVDGQEVIYIGIPRHAEATAEGRLISHRDHCVLARRVVVCLTKGTEGIAIIGDKLRQPTGELMVYRVDKPIY